MVTIGTDYQETYATGATAMTTFLEEAFRDKCNGTIYKYVANGTNTYLCERDNAVIPAATIPQTYLILHKHEDGGSLNGVLAAAPTGTDQVFNVVATAGTPPTSGLITAAACGAASNEISTCTGATLLSFTRDSELNFSDVDPEQFKSPLNGKFTGSIPSAEPVVTQVFGIVVNLRLRDALQVAQTQVPGIGVPALITDPNCGLAVGATGTAGVITQAFKDSEACMPSLTSPQIASIFGNNGLTDWSKLRTGNTLSTQNLFSVQAVANQPANRDIHICSRTAGSGTLAISHIKFHNAPCIGDVIPEAVQTDQAPVPPAQASILKSENIAPAPGLFGYVGAPTANNLKVFHAMAGSGDLENCLEGLNDGVEKKGTGSNNSFSPYPTLLPVANGSTIVTVPQTLPLATNSFRWAIGIMGTERNASESKRYRFIKIDGVSPKSENVVNGKYKFWGEAVSLPSASVLPDALAPLLLTTMRDPLKIANLDVTHAWGVTGYLGVAGCSTCLAANLPTFNTALNGQMGASWNEARPSNPYTHQTSGLGSLNHCRVPTLPAGTSRVFPIY
jgi:hypothetical protein